jgi:hypothetical protein
MHRRTYCTEEGRKEGRKEERKEGLKLSSRDQTRFPQKNARNGSVAFVGAQHLFICTFKAKMPSSSANPLRVMPREREREREIERERERERERGREREK